MKYKDFINKYKKKDIRCLSNTVLKTPSISVLVQTYQHADYIEKTLESIIRQETSFTYEILIGEDDSTDGTREMCIAYAKKFPGKIRLFLNDRINNIAIGGRPTGRFSFLYTLSKARGKYIALCDGDDYWIDVHKLEKQLNFLEENKGYSIVCSNALISQAGKDSESYNDKKEGDFTVLDILKSNFIPTSSIVFRSDRLTLPDYYVESPAGDWLLTLYLLLFGQGYYFEEPMVSYRIHPGGTWSSFSVSKRYDALKKKAHMLRGNFKLFQKMEKDQLFEKRLKEIIRKKKYSYGYQYNRLLILHKALKKDLRFIEFRELNILSYLKLFYVRLKYFFQIK